MSDQPTLDTAGNQVIELNYEYESWMDEYLIPKITFQPLVENSVLHGILETEKNEGREKLDALVKDTAAKLSLEKTPRAKSKAKKGPELYAKETAKDASIHKYL